MILSFFISMTLSFSEQKSYSYQPSEDIRIQNEATCKKKRLFQKHFQILDSAVKAMPNDTVYYCCMPSIYFMVKNTKIEVSTNGTLLGRDSFTLNDLKRWHDWYDKRYDKKRKAN